MYKIKEILLTIMLFSTLIVNAQFEKKLNTHAFIAIPFIQTNNEVVSSENVLGGYGKAPYIGFGLNYAFNTKLSIQADIRFLYASKLNNIYSISHTNIDWALKYNFIHNDKPISPYIITGFNTGTLYLSQKENSEVDTSFEDLGTSEVNHTKIEKRNAEAKFTMFPIVGVVVGGGIDFTLKKSLGVNLGVIYQTSNVHKNGLLQDFFPDNTSKFNFLMIQAGIKFSFLQSKKL